MVRAGECEAASAGVLRVTTLRFCTLAEGVETWPPILAAPSELERVGSACTPLFT